MVLDIESRLIDLDKVNCIKFFIGYDQRVVFSHYCNEVVVVRPDEEKIKKIMEVIPEEEFYKVIVNSKYFTISGDGFYNIFIRKDCLLEIDKAKEGIIFKWEGRFLHTERIHSFKKISGLDCKRTCDDLQYEVIVNKIYGDKVVYV